jgi:hypothetical protein
VQDIAEPLLDGTKFQSFDRIRFMTGFLGKIFPEINTYSKSIYSYKKPISDSLPYRPTN